MTTRFKLRILGLGLTMIAATACTAPAVPTPGATSSVPSGTSFPTSPDASVCPTPSGTGAGATASPCPATPTPSSSEPTSASTSPSPATSTTKTSGSAQSAVHRNADGSCTMPALYAGKDFETMPATTGSKVIALTFDGGASDAGDASILATLAQKDVPATFFFTGKFAEAYPARVRQVAAKYPIGNHSYSHPYFAADKLTDAQMAKQLADAEAAIVKASGGVAALPLFRFPYGDVNAHAIAVVNKQCYVPFRWTIDTLGYEGTSGGQSVSKIVAKVMAKATPGGVVLMHQGDNPTDHTTLDADALPQIIDGLRAKGYRFVTLADSLRG